MVCVLAVLEHELLHGDDEKHGDDDEGVLLLGRGTLQ